MKRLAALVVVVLFLGCENSQNSNSWKDEEAFHQQAKDKYASILDSEDARASGEFEVVPVSAQTPPPQNSVTSTRDRMLIKTGNLAMQVDDVKQSRKQIGDIANKFKAYISDEQLNDYGDRLNTSLTIRVPSSSYDTLVTLIEQVGKKTDSKSVNVQDVTEEYIDVEARLKTKKELEMRYYEILKQAHTVTDILSVESNLNNVRAEIESMEGRLKYLMSQVSFSTLNLNFYQHLSTDYGFGGKFADGLGNGWTNFLSFFIGLANIWPFLILVGVGVWLFVRWRKKRETVIVSQ